ncbi:hypothetical protein J6590_026331 [Homalodisca vitripennis]|nr:hypothetical protein J6590_026331 [Homalodisca vitripennis]
MRKPPFRSRFLHSFQPLTVQTPRANASYRRIVQTPRTDTPTDASYKRLLQAPRTNALYRLLVQTPCTDSSYKRLIEMPRIDSSYRRLVQTRVYRFLQMNCADCKSEL